MRFVRKRRRDDERACPPCPPCPPAQVSAFGVEPGSILRISAKTGLGVGPLLDALVERVPPPRRATHPPTHPPTPPTRPPPRYTRGECTKNKDAPGRRGDAGGHFRALLLDSDYNPFRGAVNVVQAGSLCSLLFAFVFFSRRPRAVADGEILGPPVSARRSWTGPSGSASG